MHQMDLLIFYLPIIGVLLSIIAVLVGKFTKYRGVIKAHFGVDIFGINNVVGLLLLAGFIISSLSSYVFMDYTDFFPNYLEMEVFYDEPSIKENLSIYSKQELANLGYKNFRKSDVEEYYSSLDNKLEEVFSYESFFSVKDGLIYSRGSTTFKVEKTEGLQKYYIAEAKGELEHTLERPGMPTLKFLSFFENTNSRYNYVRPSLHEFLFPPDVIFEPRFKQIIAKNRSSNSVTFNHVLVGVTKAYLFPYPHFSNTLYFIETKSKGLVPVAYAVYK